MTVFILGLLVFFSTHSISLLAPGLRQSAIDRIGPKAWRSLYSLISIAGLILLIWGYGLARLDPIVVWQPPSWTRHVTMTLMLFVFPMMLSAYLPGRIKATLKHPMLAAVKLWALAHLISNGTLADMLLFGVFLGWAVVERIAAKHRPLTIDLAATAKPLNDVLAVLLGLLLYGAFLGYLHLKLIGVSPLG